MSAYLCSEIPASGKPRKFVELRVYQRYSNDSQPAVAAASPDDKPLQTANRDLDVQEHMKSFISEEKAQQMKNFAAEVEASLLPPIRLLFS